MSETEPSEILLWTREGFIADDWVRAEASPLDTAEARHILSLEAFLALMEEAHAPEARAIAVELQAGEAIEPILPYLDRAAMVVLSFPAFTDGRSYSKAELLRRRHGYRGALRASGNVLIDQIAHMTRCGFTEFEIANEATQERLRRTGPNGLPIHYQPTGDATVAAASYSWRRVPA